MLVIIRFSVNCLTVTTQIVNSLIMDLIIVESPTKAKTISKFLGRQYKVLSSFGHVRDLPKTEIGIDIEHDFAPKYVIPTKAKKIVSALKLEAKKADNIILASDEDREGEAIAWHLAEVLKIDASKAQRIVFHEITETAIKHALANPRVLDFKLVDAQQARRILDRLVGYELSPFLWKKVAKGLSAGRVQSVAVKMVVEREKKIQTFIPEDFFVLSAKLEANKEEFIAALHKIDGKVADKLAIKTQAEADEAVKILSVAKFIIGDFTKRKTKKESPAPFITSTLQQTANRILGFSAKRTMMAAQKLYEQGLITYMRTDSLNMSTSFLIEVHEYIEKNIGDKYILDKPRVFKTKSKGAQEAHEAIRPTLAFSTPESLEASLEGDQHKLYCLIWQRAVATQMAPAEVDAASAEIVAVDTPYTFKADGQILRFDGYLKVCPEKFKDQYLPALEKDQKLDLKEIEANENSTKPPARYSDASLVKEMEKHGIGRPSTYAPTISTLIDRNYVIRDEAKKLKPTEIAFVVIDLLSQHFPGIVDYGFTAKVESDLDSIAEGKKEWAPVISEFYFPFHDILKQKTLEIKKSDIMPEEKSDEKCPQCGAEMVYKTGRFGKFLACSGFPDCKYIKKDKSADGPTDEKFEALKEKYKDEKCEKCGSPMALKSGRFGAFLACSGYPNCKNTKNPEEGDAPVCPKCGKGKIVKKMSRRGAFWACSAYPDCKNAYFGQPTGDNCEKCKDLMVGSQRGVVCGNKDCANSKD